MTPEVAHILIDGIESIVGTLLVAFFFYLAMRD